MCLEQSGDSGKLSSINESSQIIKKLPCYSKSEYGYIFEFCPNSNKQTTRSSGEEYNLGSFSQFSE